MKTDFKIYLTASLLGLFVHFINEFLEFLLRANFTLMDLIEDQITVHELIGDVVVFSSFILFGFIFSKVVEKRRNIEARLQDSLDKLNESEKKLSVFIEKLPLGVYRTTPEGKIISANPALITMLGYDSFEDIQKRNIESDGYESPNARNKFKYIIESEGEIIAYEEKYLKKDRSPIYLNEYAVSIKDENGNIKYYEGILENITERKQVELELMKFRKSVENSGEAIFMTNLEGIFTYVNPEFTKLYGWISEEVIGKVTPRILKSGTLDENTYKIFWETILNKEKLRGELQNKTKDGRIIIIDSSVNPIFDDNNNIEGFLAIQKDITESKLLHDEIVKSEIKYRYLFESAGDYIFVLKDLKDDGPIIIDANKAAFDEHGYTRDEMIGMKVMKLETQDSIEKNKERNLLFRNPGDMAVFEAEHVRKDGTIFPVEISARMLQIGDEEPFFISIERNIQERKENELKLLKYSEELKELNATKDKFFSIISHDLKSPLGGVMNMTHIITDEFDSISDSEKKSIMNTLSKSLNNIYDLLENLLQWANSQTNRIKFNPEYFSINEIIETTVLLLSSSLTNKKINIYKELDLTEPVFIDSYMIHTVIRNLLSNAIKFTRENGKIKISTKKYDEFIEVSIKDDGIGMDKENLSKLFRLDITQSRLGTNKERGTGLGLFLCKEFIEKHGGKIWVESQENIGSSFYFSIPIKQK